jgi:cytoskeletal protein RodZ
MGPGQFAAGAEIRNPSMLPGFRFLFAAILLSASILVFGLGAAALLRATHEQYVSNPSWRNGPQEKVFAQAPDPAQPVLAALRAEPEPTEPTPSLRDQVPTIGLPASEPEQVALTSETEFQPQVVAPPADVPAEPASAETTPDAATPAPADTLTTADTTASIAAAKPVPVALASKPTPAAPSGASASSAFDMASAKFAALNDAATTAWKDPPAKAKADSGSPESKATKPRAHRVKKRRRIVRRPPPPVQQLDPFGQPQPALAATTARARQ